MTKYEKLLEEYDKWIEKPPRAWFEYALNTMRDEGEYTKGHSSDNLYGVRSDHQ